MVGIACSPCPGGPWPQMNSAVAVTVCRASAVTILPFRLTWLSTPAASGRRPDPVPQPQADRRTAVAAVGALARCVCPEAERELGYFLNNAGPHALPLVPLPRPVHRLRRRRGRLQEHRRPAPRTSRNALDHRRRRRQHRPALRKGQQPAGSHLQHPAHSDTNRLTSPGPKMILVTYKNDVHPFLQSRPCVRAAVAGVGARAGPG